MTTALHVLCLLTSALLVVLVLAHRGSGGGLSDLLGGSGAPVKSSAAAAGNLTRFTLLVALVWVVSIVAIGLMSA